MQALPPPQLIQQCARTADEVTALISIAGSQKQIDAFAGTIRRYSKWRQEGEATGSGGTRLVVLRGPGSLPYRDIGGLIYEAQRLGLAIAFTLSAPLCEDHKK